MKVSRRLLEGVRRLPRECLEVFFNSGQVKLGKVKSGQVKSRQVKSGQA